MSLVAFNETQEWQVILRDESKKAMVLYDRNGQKLSLVNDPLLWNQFYGEPPSPQSRQSSVCPQCGQYMPDPSALPSTRLRRDRHVSRASTPAANSTIVRDTDYFKLLEYMERGEPRERSHSSTGISDNAFSQGYFDRFFVTRRLLGRGSRGAVYLVEHVLDGVSLGSFAVKKVAVGNDHVWLEKVLAEVQMLRMMAHNNLVGYNHVWLENSRLSQFGPEVPCAYILQEYCDGGTIEDYLERRQAEFAKQNEQYVSRRERLRRLSRSGVSPSSRNEMFNRDDPLIQLSKQEIVSFMTDITRGVRHLHHNQIIHRDLKPSNCLLINGKFPDELPTVLVSDFGEGQFEGLNRSATGSTGTLEYCAPELVSADANGQLAQFSKSTDIFSLGMIMYLLCFSRLPYSKNWWEEREDVDNLIEEVRNYKGFDPLADPDMRLDLSPSLYKLLAQTLSLDPLKRPTADEILHVLELEMGGTQTRFSSRDDTESVAATEVMSATAELVPSISHPAVLSLPRNFAYLQMLRFVTKWSQWLGFKAGLIFLKALSIYRLGIGTTSQVLLLLLGIEVPL